MRGWEVGRPQRPRPLDKTYSFILFLFRETAGEEDHSTYNLGVLKKPVYALTDEEIMANGGRAGMHNIGKILFIKLFHIELLFLHFKVILIQQSVVDLHLVIILMKN